MTRTATRTVKTIQTVDEIPVRTVTKRVVDGAANRPRAIGPRPVPAPEATSGRLTTLGERGNGETATRTPAPSASARSRTPLKRYEEMNLEEKVETNEKRLFETQATLVRETMKREVTENILRETAKSLSAVRKAALQGQTVEQTGGALPGSVEHQNGVLITRVKELTQKMQDLHAQHQEKERELQAVRRLLQQRENEFDLIGERPVSINVEIKELNDEGQFELIEQTRSRAATGATASRGGG